ncbi:MAG: hypothetical protein LQ338_002571 [Usnochroma carphineum]|nr:MAG: hypothetical protein LQ338_002571 [Usnochroma carphineum]
MSVWLMYDYVVHKELENTETVYHCHLDHSTNGKATRGLTKARDLFKGKDVLLLDKDIANWYPKGWICEPVKLEEVSYHLGPLTRAVTCVPPKPLLDHITNAEEISGASTARRIIDPPLIVEARVTEKDELTKERDGEECMVDQGECSWIVLEEVTRLGADTSHGLKVGDRVCALIAQEKRHFLVDNYGISHDHILSSRDLSFSKGIMSATGARGVDVVLDSLSGQMVQESWNCVAHLGRFVEIGKRDIRDKKSLQMANS